MNDPVNSAFAPSALPSSFGSLEQTRIALCPDISLWLLSSEVDLERACRELAEVPAPPYWAFCWGAGQALAHYLSLNPREVRGLRVVDLGTGSGIVAIAAARAGAARVTAVDLDLDALRAVRANALLNQVRIETRTELPVHWDVLLAADVLYEPALRERVQALARPDRRVLIADPHRPGSALRMGTALAEIEAATLPDVDPPVRRITISAL